MHASKPLKDMCVIIKYLRVCILVSLVWFATSCSSGPKPGEAAPDIELTTLEGEKVKLSDYQGKLVLLHFWTDWCDACREEFPRIQEYYADLGGKDFELLAVNVGQEVEVSKTFKKDFGVTFPMLADVDSETATIYGVEQFPTNYLINADGVVARRIIGWVDRTFVENVLYGIERHESTSMTE